MLNERRIQLRAVLTLIVAIAVALIVLDVTHAQMRRRLPRARQPQQQRLSAEQTIRHDGRQRSYVVHDFSRGEQAPLVIVLHGGGGNAENAVTMTGFDRVAAREGLIAVYPNGTAGRQGGQLLTWNAGHCCASAMEKRVDDVGFIGAVIDQLVSTGRADGSRVYVTGMSNGGMMAHRLGRELSAKIAAIAPVVGAVFGDEPPPAAPVAAFIVVGAEDTIVPPAGGSLALRGILEGRAPADRGVAPAMDQATYWARANGCEKSTPSIRPAVNSLEWRTCTSGKPVIFHSVTGNGHAWPGGKPGREGAAIPTRDYDASEEIWKFFREQRPRSSAH